jgi:hypothetical protein
LSFTVPAGHMFGFADRRLGCAATGPGRARLVRARLHRLRLAVGLMLGLIVVPVVVAGRIYEGAVLRTGSKVALGEAWRSGRRT